MVSIKIAINYFYFINLDLEGGSNNRKRLEAQQSCIGPVLGSKKLHFPNSSKNAVTLFCTYIPVHIAPHPTKFLGHTKI
jgi:hypothetical protein